MQSQTKIFSRLVRDYMRTSPVIVPARSRVSELLAQMAAAKAASALITDRSGKLAGIITEQDVTRRIALRCDGSERVTAVMTAPVESVAAEDYLYTAIARMRRFGWRHMPVVDRDERPVGEIVLHDALAVAGEQIVRQIERITHEGSLDGLREVKAAQADVAADLLDDNVPAPEIQALITDINRDIHRRIIAAQLAAMDAEGWGEPPVPFAVIIMGSGGRGENFLFPDQDNGVILDDYPDAGHARVDRFFIELAERMTRDLDAVGFPFCRGYVMATNPLWRKTRAQWRDQLLLWGRRRSTIAIQLSDIFFDFLGIYGRADFARELRQRASAMAKNSPAYLQEMEHEAHEYGVALGWFGRFITEKEKPEHKGEINLKHAATLPLVGAVRLLALRQGIEDPSTLARINALHESGVLDADEQDYLSGAFHHITFLLLRQQLADFRAGREVGNYVHPDRLSEREKDILVDSLKAIDALQKRVHSEFTAEVF
ncbi:MAG: putative nucleotidyltransferase substrate binding domain-containing protein [Kiloniellaceae bacterium]